MSLHIILSFKERERLSQKQYNCDLEASQLTKGRGRILLSRDYPQDNNIRNISVQVPGAQKHIICTC